MELKELLIILAIVLTLQVVAIIYRLHMEQEPQEIKYLQ